MNKTERMLAIVLELQAGGRRRAEDLASTFETSKRTIYRDIQALCEAGVPLVSVPGRGYSLMQGYFLPPLSFTTDEAIMLLLGSDYMAQSFDAQYRTAAQAAGRKIAGVLPERLREDVRAIQESIRLIAPRRGAEDEKLQQIRRAILDRRGLRFRYHTRHASNGTAPVESTREADPYALVHVGSAWHLVAYCHLRRGIRHFRLERIENLEVLERTFQRPSGLTFPAERQDELPRSLVVRALFDAEVARWVRESPSFYMTDAEETPEGLLATFHVRRESDLLQWLLGWGRHVRVLEPASLRTLLRQEAEAILQMNQPES